MDKDKLFIDNIINKLKKKEIKPNKTYYQNGDNFCYYKNFPVGEFVSLDEAEQKNNDIDNELQIITLNESYQYKTVITHARESIDISSITFDKLGVLSNGVHYFISDAEGELCLLSSVKQTLQYPTYIRILKKSNGAPQIQKRVLISIWKTSYVYWDNHNVRKEVNEKLDINGNILYQVTSFYDKKGEHIKSMFYNSATHHKEIYKINNPANPFFEIDIYNEAGKRTNHIVGHDLAEENIHNHYLDEKGDIIKITHGLMDFFNSTQEFPIRSACQFLSAEFNKVSAYAHRGLLNSILFYNNDKPPKALDILRIFPMEKE